MTTRDVLKQLADMGTEQNRKIYARHGIGLNMYGVSIANLEKLRKQIKCHHALAQELWRSGNHDARMLAAMVADPNATAAPLLNAWIKEADNHLLSDTVAALAFKTPHARKLATQWRKSAQELVATAGWGLTARLTADTSLPDDEFAELLRLIEAKIHTSKNRVRYMMNNTVIAIGLRSPAFERLAIAAAQRIGKVEVDHGETGCKTPDAVDYIKKAAAYRAKRGKKK